MVRIRGRKRALGTRAAMTIPHGADQPWSVDFAADALLVGQRFRVLCVIDDFNRECLATVVYNSITEDRVPRELDYIAQRREVPLLTDTGLTLTPRQGRYGQPGTLRTLRATPRQRGRRAHPAAPCPPGWNCITSRRTRRARSSRCRAGSVRTSRCRGSDATAPGTSSA